MVRPSSMKQVSLAHLEGVPPHFFKFCIWREAYNLWHQRQIPRRVAGMAAQREQQGMDASHLWCDVPGYVMYAKAYAAELDRLGWLVPIERILKSEKFNRQYAQDQKVVHEGKSDKDRNLPTVRTGHR